MRENPVATDLVIFSPLPPTPNGIADYAYELLTGLAREFNCTVVIANEQAEALVPEGVAVVSAAEYLLDAARFSTATHIYEIGNNPDHFYMLPFMAERPGIVVLHDPSLHNLLDGVSVRVGDFSCYADALEAEYGVAGRILGDQFRRFHLRERSMFFDLPMIGGIAGPSRGVIVHSRYAAAKVLAHAPRTPVTIAPHQYVPPSPDELDDALTVRRSLGVRDDETLFMSLGFMTRAKRIDAVLGALAIARDRLPPFKYVIAGEINEREIDVRAEVASRGLDGTVTTLGYVDERTFFSLIPAADVVINLRYPVAGETSGTMIRALGGGACVVVVDRGPFAEIPHDAAVRIAWSPDFERHLGDRLVQLARDPELRRRIGENARQFIARNNRLDQTVAGYRRAVDLAQSNAGPAWATRAIFEFLPPHRLSEAVGSARAALGRRHLPLWFEVGAVPVCDGRPPRTLVVGESDADLLDRLGYRRDAGQTRHVAAIGAIDVAPDDARATDLAIVLPDAALAADDPDAALAWLNRTLAFGGIAVWHCALKAGDPTGPAMMQRSAVRLFEAYGFRVDAAFAGSPPLIDDPPDQAIDGDLADERCWRLRKVSETFSRPDLRSV
jgi:glycosyltransferase involved in cell wall biosynthesis